MRSDEAGRLEWTDLDRERGAVRLDKNKTDDPRAWALTPDVVRALRIWRALCPSKRYVFVGARNNRLPGNNGAERLREHLMRAGIDRAELFESGKDEPVTLNGRDPAAPAGIRRRPARVPHAQHAQTARPIRQTSR